VVAVVVAEQTGQGMAARVGTVVAATSA
jgi:hypothetical protein